MKSHFKLFSVFLSIIIAYLSMFQCNMTVYASSGGGHSRPGDNDNDKFLGNYDNIGDFLLQEADKLIAYVVGQTKAIYSGDFSTVVQNDELFDEYFNPDHITYSDDVDGKGTPGIVFDEDLTAYMKQALIEYSEETNGFYIVRTTPFSSIDLQQFRYKTQYTTLSTLVSQCKLIAVNKGSSSMMVASLSDVYDNGYSFVYPSSTIDTPRRASFAYIYDSDWKRYTMPFYVFSFTEDTPAYGSLFSGSLASDLPNYRVYSFSSFSPNYCLVNHGSIYSQNTGTSLGSCLISNDGRNVRVFKNLDAFKLYTTNNRSVYFSKDFYESTPGEITATWDEIADSVANIDKSFQDLLDKIDSTTDENTIEDLLQQILDELKGSGGGGGGSQGDDDPGGSYDDTGLLAVLSGYFDSVLAYLDQILSAIEALVWIEADDSSLTDDQKDLFDLIDKIWDNPETGSQEMADELGIKQRTGSDDIKKIRSLVQPLVKGIFNK